MLGCCMEDFPRRMQLGLVIFLLFVFGILILASLSLISLSNRANLQEVYTINQTEFNSFYDHNYPCTPMHCLVKKETLPFIVSEQGHSFLLKMELPLIFGTILLIMLLVVLSKTIGSGVRNTGIVIVGIGTLYFSNLLLKLFVWSSAVINMQKAIFFIYEPIKIITLSMLAIGLLLIIIGWYIER